jgi:hypothetical protein
MMKNNRKLLFILIFAIPLVAIFLQCRSLSSDKPDPRGNMYAGSATCIKCHRDVYDNFLHTAHFSTTRLADIHSIGGSFKNGENVYYFNKDLKVVMEKRDSGLYQVAYFKGKMIQAERFDITFGGVKAESYLFWKANETYQLPMSYFSALHNWTNSPGFDNTKVDYVRMIGRRCFECHTSYIKDLPPQTESLVSTEQFDKNSLILGIDCERCHGPAANHVNYQTDNPGDKQAKYITTYNSLSRAQKIDMCAVCHSGNKGTMLRSTFAFKPGDTLAKFKEVDLYQAVADSAKLDVHGNQSQLLGSSKCFINSKMDCATCHNVHVNDRPDIALYSQKCMDCHKTADHNFCKMAPLIGGIIKNNCIDCHMPAKPSTVISVGVSGKGSAIPYLVRTHRIAVYADATQTVLNNFKKYNKLQLNR